MSIARTKTLTAGEIFGVKKAYELVNYIERDGVDDVFLEALENGKHVSLFGASKTGKSSLIERQVGDGERLYIQCTLNWDFDRFVDALLNAAYGRTDQEIVSEQKKETTVTAGGGISLKARHLQGELSGQYKKSGSHLIRLIDKRKYDLNNFGDFVRLFEDLGYGRSSGYSKIIYIVIDDFHRMTPDTQEKIANLSKMLFDNSNVVFICVGIWAEDNKLSSLCAELMGRCVDVNSNLWPEERLIEVIENGYRMLNVEMPQGFSSAVAKSARGSVFIVQETCAEACRQLGIKEASPHLLTIDKTLNADMLVHRVTEKHCNFTDLHNKLLSLSDNDTDALYVYEVLLNLPVNSRGVLSMDSLQTRIEERHPDKIFNKYFAYNACIRLSRLATEKNFRNVLDVYRDSDNNLKLALIDPTFKFWLKGRRAQFTTDVKDRISSASLAPSVAGGP